MILLYVIFSYLEHPITMDGKNIKLTSCAYGMIMRMWGRKFYTLTLVVGELIVYVRTFGGTFVGSS
jgi:hypothetical protein